MNKSVILNVTTALDSEIRVTVDAHFVEVTLIIDCGMSGKEEISEFKAANNPYQIAKAIKHAAGIIAAWAENEDEMEMINEAVRG